MGLFDIFRRKKTEEKENIEVTEPEIVASEIDDLDEKSVEVNDETIDDKKTISIDDSQFDDEPLEEKGQEKENEPVALDEEVSSDEEEIIEEKYDEGLQKTRSSFSERFNQFLANFRSVDNNFFDELEETLIGSDVGFEMALQISNELRQEVKLKNAKNQQEIKNVIIEKLVDIYEESGGNNNNAMQLNAAGKLSIVLVVGVNGVGKTTTIGKMASYYSKLGKKVALVAADTFRAGAIKQLQEWGERTNVPVVCGKENSDPASVVFEGVQFAKNNNIDILFVDTAGRLQNNVNLMQELEKITKIIRREAPESLSETLLVLDATTGQNALQQAKIFKDSSQVSGIVLTKMDGTAKGGIVLAIRKEMQLPVKWIGLGESADDLQSFDPNIFVYSLFKDLVEV